MTESGILTLVPEQSSLEQRANLLEESKWTTVLAWDQMQIIAEDLVLYSVPTETAVISEGERIAFLGIVVEGKLSIEKADSSGEKSVLASLGKGKAIGEISFFDNYPASATARAQETTSLLVLTRARFEELCAEKPAVANMVMQILGKIMAARLRQASGKLVEYAVTG